MSNLRIEKRNLWKDYNWKEVSIELTLFGFTVIGFLWGREWFMFTLLNFQLDVEWFAVFLDEEDVAWAYLLEDEEE